MGVPLYELGIRLDKVHLLRRVLVNYSSQERALFQGQFHVLDYILDHPGCTQKEIADWLQISPASIALSTKKLKRAGLIQKENDAENLRRNRLTATEKGACQRDLFRKQMDAFDEKMFRGFTEEEKVLLLGMLDRLIVNIAPEKYRETSKEVMELMRKDLKQQLRSQERGDGVC